MHYPRPHTHTRTHTLVNGEAFLQALLHWASLVTCRGQRVVWVMAMGGVWLIFNYMAQALRIHPSRTLACSIFLPHSLPLDLRRGNTIYATRQKTLLIATLKKHNNTNNNWIIPRLCGWDSFSSTPSMGSIEVHPILQCSILSWYSFGKIAWMLNLFWVVGKENVIKNIL